MRTATLIHAIALTTAMLPAATTTTRADATQRADTTEYQIIVHPANHVDAVDKDFVRMAFLKKVATWRNDTTIRPAQLSRRFPLRDRFTREVLKKTPIQLRSYWNQQVFSGKAVPPPEFHSEAAVISYVLANRGAIGYLPASANPRGAKVIRLR